MKLKSLLLSASLIITYSIHAQNYSYIWQIQFPNLIEPTEVCCFDYTGDGTPDNSIGQQLSTFDSDGLLQPAINAGILTSTIVKAFDWQDLDLSLTNQDFTFQFLDARNYTPLLTLEERMSGLSTLYLTPNQDENLFTASINNGFLTASADLVSGLLNIQFDEDQGLVALNLHDVKVESQLLDSPIDVVPGTYTENSTATNPTIIGGMKLGGIITSEDFLGVLDTQYRTCECAGVNPDEDFITTSVFFNTMIVQCNQSGLIPENCDTQPFCTTIDEFCSNAQFLGLTFDVDSDNDNVKDAYSVGLRLGAAATTIIDVIYINGFDN